MSRAQQRPPGPQENKQRTSSAGGITKQPSKADLRNSSQRALSSAGSSALSVGLVLCLSLGIHVSAFVVVSGYSRSKTVVSKPLAVKIVRTEKPKPIAVVEPKKEEPLPPKPEPKPKAKPKKIVEKKVASERRPKVVPAKAPAPPQQGLAPTALSKNGTGIAVPVGNTLMVADNGKRLKAEDVQPLSNEDLSADAKLIRTSVKTPEYTDEAIDAGLEGTYIIDVYVDQAGKVTSAELPKKVGYGMDERLIASAKQAKFQPKKDRYGRALAGWAEMKFRLELP